MSDRDVRSYLREWWVLSEVHDAHFVSGFEWEKSFMAGVRCRAGCGADLTQVIKQGFQAKGVIVSCDCVQIFGACKACLVHIVRDLHFGAYNMQLMGYPCPNGHPCEIDKLHAKLIEDGILVGV